VLVAEDDSLLRDGIIRLLESVEDIEVTAGCADLPQLEAAVLADRPDVVVTDIRMPPTGTDEGLRAAAWLHEEWPEVAVVVLSQYVNPEYAVALLGSGAGRRAYLLKDRVSDVGELARAIREVACGGSVIDPRVVEALVAASRTRPRSPIEHLTPRELEVLGLMAQGKSNAAIAASLVLSERAIEKHSNAIFVKLGVSEERDRNRRVSAVLVYLDSAVPKV
jgi:DNA-binding NarL/FixJ family response regulator